jgi:hypothetical protein
MTDETRNKGGRPRTYRDKTVGVRMTEEEWTHCKSMNPDGDAASYLRTLMEQHKLYLERLPGKSTTSST